MPRYHQLGKIPHKRHTVFSNGNVSMYQEELFGTAGFAGMSSLLYHIYPPTLVSEFGDTESENLHKPLKTNSLIFSGYRIVTDVFYFSVIG